MNVTIECKAKASMNFEEIVKAIRSGEHTKLFNVGDKIEIAGISHVIIGMDVEDGLTHSMTIQRHDNIEYTAFARSGSNVYKNSDVRKYLNGDYGDQFPEEFIKAIKPIKIDGMDGEERFFLLHSRDVNLTESKYPFYHKRENRTHYDKEGYVTSWWFRDPGTGNSSIVRGCSEGGVVTNHYAYYGYRGLLPACVIA